MNKIKRHLIVREGAFRDIRLSKDNHASQSIHYCGLIRLIKRISSKYPIVPSSGAP